MRVLLLTPTYYPVIGGGEAHARYLAEGLARRNHNVSVVTDDLNLRLPAQEFNNGVEILRTQDYSDVIHRPDRVPWEEHVFGLLRQFELLLPKARIDIIHAHGLVSAILGAMMKNELQCKLVVSTHETQPALEAMGRSRSDFIFGCVPYDLLIAGSRFFYELAASFHAPRERIRLIHYGVDTSHFHPGVERHRIRRALNLSMADRLVLLIGRFKTRKGIVEFVHAMAAVISQEPTARALISGTCHSASLEYLAEVERTMLAAGCQDRIVLRNQPWTYAEMPEVYAAADLVVQPSYAEGFGLALLEAMAVGRPVIGSDVSGIREIIRDGETGWLVPPKDEIALARAILKLLKDGDEARRLGDNGCRFVQTSLNSDRMVEETIAAYQRVLSA